MSQEDEEIQKLLNRSADLARDLRSAVERNKELRRAADRLRQEIITERTPSTDEVISE